MRPSRLRSGEILAGLGAIALLVALFPEWFGNRSGWGSLGWLALVPIVVAIALGLALVVATLVERDSAAIPVALGVVTVPWALLAVLAILVRLVAQPGPNAETSVRWPAWLGLAAAVAILLGAWRALADERTHTAHTREQTERALSVRGTPREVPPLDSEPHDRP